ncbi:MULTISPECIES: ROK family transcriptional regulator [Asticcacaulis]|uniref:ROK family transcriptional regulator n=1 Tax=Asticcacaulis TaxID=76890 RepID=UPI001AE3E4E0|nr:MULTISPECIES: ROK family transcriptional regulator [Asticcacaulis]MBP2158282.1 putative NBD/HSP70 family sugar kinase [Asticcacaulis solisilvae]MDR6799327.1 putative NBD/HSP70 family sugar kinase [Asticcacaulis sp. BE141]
MNKQNPLQKGLGTFSPPSHAKLGLRGANIVDAGKHNRRMVLQAIRVRTRATRVDIAEATGLSVPSIFKITKQLAENGLIIVDGRKNGERGQPAIELAINPDGAFSLGLNIDRDHLTLVVLDFSAVVRMQFHAEIAFAGPEAVRVFVRESLSEALSDPVIGKAQIKGIGVAIPDDLGAITLPGQPDSYREWSDVTAQSLLEDIVDFPIFHENDAAAAAIGEMHFGGGQESNSFFYLLLNAGLGGGLVVNRQYHRGARGRSGEIGFLPQFNPFRSRRTNLQKTLGDGLLLSHLYDVLRENGIRAQSPKDLEGLNLERLPCVREWIAEVSDYLYPALLTLTYGIDPDAIYIGGRLPQVLQDALCDELSKRLSMNLGVSWSRTIVRKAVIKENAAALGAAALPFDTLWNATPAD